MTPKDTCSCPCHNWQGEIYTCLCPSSGGKAEDCPGRENQPTKPAEKRVWHTASRKKLNARLNELDMAYEAIVDARVNPQDYLTGRISELQTKKANWGKEND